MTAGPTWVDDLWHTQYGAFTFEAHVAPKDGMAGQVVRLTETPHEGLRVWVGDVEYVPSRMSPQVAKAQQDLKALFLRGAEMLETSFAAADHDDAAAFRALADKIR